MGRFSEDISKIRAKIGEGDFLGFLGLGEKPLDSGRKVNRECVPVDDGVPLL